MKSTVEPVEGNKVKVAVEVDEVELEPAVDAAWRQISKEVRLPGFRPGKAPRKLLEKQFGADYARSEALRNALPDFYSRAVIEHDVDVIAAPELDITGGETDGPVSFEAVVEVRPEIEVEGYHGLRVEVPRPDASDDEVSEQVDRLRGQYAEISETDRVAGDQDYVTIDIEGSVDGEAVEGLTADDYLYLVGSGMIVAEFDEQLMGAGAGTELEFEADHPDPEQGRVQFRLSVKNVKERVLPELDDEWVADATEFETVSELIEDTRARLSSTREEQTRNAVRVNLGQALAALVEVEAPEAMVSSEAQARLQNLAYNLGNSGIRIEDYLQITGRDPESFSDELREAAVDAVKVDLALRAVARNEGLAATETEVEEEIIHLIGSADVSVEDATEELRDSGQLSAVRSGVTSRKAMEWLVSHSEFVDEDGNAVADDLLVLPDHDHDHDDHDHDGHDHGHDQHDEDAE
ncbi:MAG: trigger factor [Microthrixaceae bacterium]